MERVERVERESGPLDLNISWYNSDTERLSSLLTVCHVVSLCCRCKVVLLRLPGILGPFVNNVLIEIFYFLFRFGVVFNTLNRFIFNKITDLEIKTVRKF